MLKACQRQADWQNKENISVTESEEEKKRKICHWMSWTLLQTVHCFFTPPDIKAPSFLLSQRKCYGAMAQFVTHIIWISAPLYFHKSCHAKREKNGRGDGKGERGPTKKEAKWEKRGIKRTRGGRRGAREEAVIWDLFNSEWMRVTCVCVRESVNMCMHLCMWGTKTFKTRRELKYNRAETSTEPCVHLLRAAVLQQGLNQDILIFFRGLFSELLLTRHTARRGVRKWKDKGMRGRRRGEKGR